jgi:hypothetical protein
MFCKNGPKVVDCLKKATESDSKLKFNFEKIKNGSVKNN